ncbi:MAG: hypothetical protein IJ876_03505 [Elusimicrobiaceae bacterium]|nr:hypothetical protein [Elusimicrobiaceae bacterium]
MEDDFELEMKEVRASRQVGHLHRKLFLLVFAVALLAQGIMGIEKGLSDYYRKLYDSFKIILTVDGPVDAAQLEEWGQTLNQKEDITSVRLLSPDDGLAVVRHKNPQLVESLLLMGKNKMPAYFEITLSAPAIANIRPLVDNLDAEYEELTPRYDAAHAQLLFQIGLYSKLLRGLGALALLGFLAFMFLVEAAPYAQQQALSGLFSGLLAGVLSGGILAAVVYPTGLLADMLAYFTTWPRQGLLVVFCGLFGWTLSKWQRF